MNTAASYLDYNASVPILPEVAEEVHRMLLLGGNPSSVHRAGRLARRCVEDARSRVAALVGAEERGVVFTSGGTEANNLALRGTVAKGGVGRILISAMEHDAVSQAAHVCGVPVSLIPVTGDGVIDLDALKTLLAADRAPALVSVMAANNETGVLQPMDKVAHLVAGAGGLLHCDAIQAAGRIALSMSDLGADLLSLSSHKIGGPTGVGALVARTPEVMPDPILFGGGQESGRRAGTENVAGIAGFGVAAMLARETLGTAASLGALRDDLEARILAVAPTVPIYGRNAPRLCNTSYLGMPGVSAQTQVMAFDLAGLQVSAGAACSSGKVAASRVLSAMGVPPEEAASAVRVSVGWGSTGRDIDRFVGAWTQLFERTNRESVDGGILKEAINE